MISFLPLKKESLSFSSLIFSIFHVLSPLRLKGQPADLPDGGGKKPSSQLEGTPSPNTNDKHTDIHIASPHHCEMKTSRLPTLPEEETSDFKSPDPIPAVREEADGKDDAAEVNIQYNDLHFNSDMLFKSQISAPSSSSFHILQLLVY